MFGAGTRCGGTTRRATPSRNRLRLRPRSESTKHLIVISESTCNALVAGLLLLQTTSYVDPSNSNFQTPSLQIDKHATISKQP